MTYARARDHTPAAWDQDETANVNLSATTFAEASPRVVTRFRGPTSGKVIVTAGGGVRDSSVTNRIYLAPRVRNGFGSNQEILTPDPEDNGFCGGPVTGQYFFGQRSVLLDGLTSGLPYIATCEYAVEAAATTDLACRDILVESVPGPMKAGEIARAVDCPPAVQAMSTSTFTNVTSTSFTDGDPNFCEVDFIACSSGRALVTVGGGVRAASGDRIFLSVRITNNAGTAAFVEGPGINRYSLSSMDGSLGNAYTYLSRTFLIEGLEPGGSYNAQVQHRTNAGGSNTGDITVRTILVEPTE